ncbi:voltage-gated potassium channel [Aureococcus anophagefferens]|nr:voltage-gated potassium channel [Aureococcus anophagefferens]
MAVCADEMVACLEETAGLGPNVDQSAVGLSLEADSAALRPVLKKLEGLLARIEERRVRSLRLAEIDGDGVITYGEPEEERYGLSRPGGLAPLLDAPEARGRAAVARRRRARHPLGAVAAYGGPSPLSSVRESRTEPAPATGGQRRVEGGGRAVRGGRRLRPRVQVVDAPRRGDTASAPSRDLAVVEAESGGRRERSPAAMRAISEGRQLAAIAPGPPPADDSPTRSHAKSQAIVPASGRPAESRRRSTESAASDALASAGGRAAGVLTPEKHARAAPSGRTTWRKDQGDRAKIAEELRAKHRPEGMPLLKQISVKTAHAAIGHATLHSARHTEKHGDESKEPARPRTARDAKAPRTHTMMLQSEAGKAAQTTELLFRARCREIFNNIDADHSGEIDLEELGVAMKLLGREMAPEAVKEMMAKFDKDGDGNLDMDEFVALMSEKEKERSERAAEVLKQRAEAMARQGNMAKLKKRMVQTDGIAMPDNTFVQIWDIMTMRQFDTYCDIVFVVDIVKNFHVGYVDANDVLHMDRKEIARNYLTGWFWPDVASVISVLKWIDMGDSETFLSILKMVKLFKLFRTARLLDHLAPYWYQVQDYYHFHISDAWIKLCKLFFFLIVLAHWMGCVSYALARFWNFPRSSWVVVAGLVDEDGANLKTVISQYSWCVCRALGLIVMESYESPYSSGTCVETDGWCTIETWTILLSLYVGSIFYAALISNISSIVGDMNVSKRRFEEMVHNTDEYMITKNIPRDLRERVREFYHLRYAKGRIFDEGQILDSLNAELRTEIASYNTRAVVSVVPLLANSPLRFTRAMTVDMSPTIYFARDLVVQEGNSGDEMFFISNGMAEILLRACGNVAIHVISDGCYFGEVAVLFDGKRTASIRTLSVTVMYSLSSKSLLAAIADFPEIEAYLQRIAKLRRDFLLELGKAFAEDTPLPEKDDPEDKLTGLYGFEEQASAARLTHANSVYPEFDHASKTPSPQKLTPRGGPGPPGAPKPNLANSPSKGHLAMLKNQPTKAELAILDDRPSVSFSPAEVLEAASQERAKKPTTSRCASSARPSARATVVQMKGSAGDQRHNVRKFARATGQF